MPFLTLCINHNPKFFYFDDEFQNPMPVDKMSRDPMDGLFPQQEVMEKLGVVCSSREAMNLQLEQERKALQSEESILMNQGKLEPVLNPI